MSLKKILGVITEEKVKRIEVNNKHIKIISNRLEKENIPHLIIDDSTKVILKINKEEKEDKNDQ